MHTRRIACLVGITLLAGCSERKPAEPTSAKSPALSVGPANSTAAKNTEADPAAKEQAQLFLTTLASGDFKRAGEMTSISFRKLVSGSLTFEEERKLGYSDSDTEKYLRAAAAGCSEPAIEVLVSSPSELSRSAGVEVSVRGHWAKSPAPAAFALRMVKETDGWKVTRFAAHKPSGLLATRSAKVEPYNDWARESARDFLDALLGGDGEHLMTMETMSEAFKTRLPSPSLADAGLKYSKKDVRAWLTAARHGASKYEINGFARDGTDCTFSGELTGEEKPAKFKLIVDDAKVTDFQVTQ
jgi:hypothetical protein